MKEDHKGHRQKAKEETSSSKSGYHFGHYMAGLISEYIDHFHALNVTLPSPPPQLSPRTMVTRTVSHAIEAVWMLIDH